MLGPRGQVLFPGGEKMDNVNPSNLSVSGFMVFPVSLSPGLGLPTCLREQWPHWLPVALQA